MNVFVVIIDWRGPGYRHSGSEDDFCIRGVFLDKAEAEKAADHARAEYTGLDHELWNGENPGTWSFDVIVEKHPVQDRYNPPAPSGPGCGHFACRQNWIETGSAECVLEEARTAVVPQEVQDAARELFDRAEKIVDAIGDALGVDTGTVSQDTINAAKGTVFRIMAGTE